MKILFCKTFGIGNLIMAIPTIRALKSLGHTVDVLVGDTHDDVGALDVLKTLKQNFPGDVDDIHVGCVLSPAKKHDLAILSIPYDGRWKNGVHFDAENVVDGRTRPDPSTTGLSSWLKSEHEYQLDNARDMGWICYDFEPWYPTTRIFHPEQIMPTPHSFYFGVGYKKDQNNFWSAKHWGTDCYIELARLILAAESNAVIYMTGDEADLKLTIAPMLRALHEFSKRVVYVPTSSVAAALKIVSCCETYVGNDTGMMHVAAAAGRNVLGLFFLKNSHIKNPPVGARWQTVMHNYDRKPTPLEVFEELKDRC